MLQQFTMGIGMRIALSCLIASLMGLLAFRFADQYQPGMINDDAYYYLGALSLARTGNYLDLADPLQAPQRHYTPGYPLLLSVFLKIFPENPSTARWVSGLLISFSLGYMFVLGAPLLGIGWALVACSWMLFLPATSVWGTALLSEIPYLALSLVIIGLMLKPRRGAVWLLAGLLACLFLIRPIALTLIIAYAVWAALKKDFKAAGVMAVLCLFLFGSHFFWANSGNASSSYHQEFIGPAKGVLSAGGAAGALIKKLRYYAGEFTGTFIPWNILISWGNTGYACGILLSILPLAGLIWGGIQPLSGLWGLLSLYSLLYLAVHVIAFPAVSGRYLFPLLPILYCLTSSGWKRLCAGRRKWPSYLSAWIALGLAVNLWGLYSLDRSPGKSLPARMPTETFAWLKATSASGDIIAADVCAPVTLYAGRSCVPWPYLANPDQLLDRVFASGAGYILLRESQDIQKRLDLKGDETEGARRASAIRTIRATFVSVRADPKEGTEIFKAPDHPDSYRKAYAVYQEGEAVYRSRRPQQAKRFFQKALALDRRLCDARIYLASFEMGAGRAQAAIPLLRESAALCPGYPLARISYAQSLGAANQFAQARQELEAARDLSRDTQGVQSDLKIYQQAEMLLRLIPRG